MCHMFDFHWDMGRYLLPIPLSFVLRLKMNITFFSLYKKVWVCFLACFTFKIIQIMPVLKDISFEWEHNKTHITGHRMFTLKHIWVCFLPASYKEVEEKLPLIKHSFLQLSLVGIPSSHLFIIQMIVLLERFQAHLFAFVKSHFISHWYEWNLETWLMFWQYEMLQCLRINHENTVKIIYLTIFRASVTVCLILNTKNLK